MRLLTGISIASLVVAIAALVFVLGLYNEFDKSDSDTATLDAPVLDEETVIALTYGSLIGFDFGEYRRIICAVDKIDRFSAKYAGEDIWIVKVGDDPRCTIPVHDKEAQVIMPK